MLVGLHKKLEVDQATINRGQAQCVRCRKRHLGPDVVAVPRTVIVQIPPVL